MTSSRPKSLSNQFIVAFQIAESNQRDEEEDGERVRNKEGELFPETFGIPGPFSGCHAEKFLSGFQKFRQFENPCKSMSSVCKISSFAFNVQSSPHHPLQLINLEA